ncbi:MAG: iron-containing alcohol dehydrogenase [Aristaeellaceae bacterium]
MFIMKAAFCRVFQAAFRLALPLLPYREPAILRSLPELVQTAHQKGLANILMVTDEGIVRHGLVHPVEDALHGGGIACTIYDKTQPNPTVDNVEEALSLYRARGCDGLLAIGGGSAMDCAKAVGARLAQPFMSLRQMKGILRVLRPLPTLIAIPTTAGTGSEVTLAAVITDSARHDKYALMSFPLIPHYAVLDASLTVSLPPHLTATTGMDALTHAIEAYIGRSTTRKTRQLAVEAIRLVFGNLETVYAHGSSLPARENMLHAAYKAGAAFSQSYVGYVHALAHALGGQYGTPHGLANAILLPWVLEAYGEKAHRKLHALGVAAGICTQQDSHAAGAGRLIQAIRAMNARMGIPEKVPGIRREDIALLARHAQREANPLYPVPRLMTARELAAILEQAADWGEHG